MIGCGVCVLRCGVWPVFRFRCGEWRRDSHQMQKRRSQSPCKPVRQSDSSEVRDDEPRSEWLLDRSDGRMRVRLLDRSDGRMRVQECYLLTFLT